MAFIAEASMERANKQEESIKSGLKNIPYFYCIQFLSFFSSGFCYSFSYFLNSFPLRAPEGMFVSHLNRSLCEGRNRKDMRDCHCCKLKSRKYE